MTFSRILLLVLCVVSLSACRNFDPFGFEAQRKAEEAEQQRRETVQIIEEKKVQTRTGENLLAYLTRVSETHKQSGSVWEYELEESLLPFTTYALSDSELTKTLELESVGNWLQTPPPSFKNVPPFWLNFLADKVPGGRERYAKLDEPQIALSYDHHYYPQRFVQQHGEIYTAFLVNHSGTMRRIGVMKVTPASIKQYFSIKDKLYKATNAPYAAMVKRGYGDPTQMKAILTMLLCAEGRVNSFDWNTRKDGTINIPSNPRINVTGVISSTLKGNGWCESVVRVVKEYSQVYTLMIRTQIAPDGTPLYMEYFSL